VPKSTRKRKERDVVPVPESAPAPAEKKSRARKMSFSTPKGENELVVQKKRKTTRSSVGKEDGESGSHHAHAGEIADLDSIDMVGMTPDVDGSMADGKTVDSSKATVIALPFSDTPIINRNKELRKKGTGGARRSSLGLRGRRASSLIDGGHNAIPHREVDTSEFYKHIEAEGLSEPRRMKQLLTWTGERALGEKPSHGDPDSAAALAGNYLLFPQPGIESNIRSASNQGVSFKRFRKQVRILRLVQ
jgi:kinetochore protein Mis13/DSN1